MPILSECTGFLMLVIGPLGTKNEQNSREGGMADSRHLEAKLPPSTLISIFLYIFSLYFLGPIQANVPRMKERRTIFNVPFYFITLGFGKRRS